MFPFKSMTSFFLRFALIYVVLLLPWPGVEGAYAHFFQAGGNFLFASFGSQGLVLFQPHVETNRQEDTLISFTKQELVNEKREAHAGRGFTDSRYAGYMETIFLLALILATPIRRKRWSLFWGLILIHAFIAFRVALLLLYFFNSYPPVSFFELSPFWDGILSLAYQVFGPDNLNFGLIISVLIWIVVSFRRAEWAKIRQKLDFAAKKAIPPNSHPALTGMPARLGSPLASHRGEKNIRNGNKVPIPRSSGQA